MIVHGLFSTHKGAILQPIVAARTPYRCACCRSHLAPACLLIACIATRSDRNKAEFTFSPQEFRTTPYVYAEGEPVVEGAAADDEAPDLLAGEAGDAQTEATAAALPPTAAAAAAADPLDMTAALTQATQQMQQALAGHDAAAGSGPAGEREDLAWRSGLVLGMYPRSAKGEPRATLGAARHCLACLRGCVLARLPMGLPAHAPVPWRSTLVGQNLAHARLPAAPRLGQHHHARHRGGGRGACSSRRRFAPSHAASLRAISRAAALPPLQRLGIAPFDSRAHTGLLRGVAMRWGTPRERVSAQWREQLRSAAAGSAVAYALDTAAAREDADEGKEVRGVPLSARPSRAITLGVRALADHDQAGRG